MPSTPSGRSRIVLVLEVQLETPNVASTTISLHDGQTYISSERIPVSTDLLYDRLQEHTNNALRRLTNELTTTVKEWRKTK